MLSVHLDEREQVLAVGLLERTYIDAQVLEGHDGAGVRLLLDGAGLWHERDVERAAL